MNMICVFNNQQILFLFSINISILYVYLHCIVFSFPQNVENINKRALGLLLPNFSKYVILTSWVKMKQNKCNNPKLLTEKNTQNPATILTDV